MNRILLLKFLPIGKKIFPKFLKRKIAKFLNDDLIYSAMTDQRSNNLLFLLEKALKNTKRGEIIECGVYKGGSCLAMAKKLKSLKINKKIFALDTFEGMPYDYEEFEYEHMKQKNPKHLSVKGILSDTNLEKIKDVFEQMKLGNVTFLKGKFVESFAKISDKKFCFAHVDADLYLSTKQCLEFLQDRMVTNGIIVFDDYGSDAWVGAKKAVDEILGESSIIMSGPGLQAYWQKKS